jgi:ABC-type amino acid transport substrate-binding protein
MIGRELAELPPAAAPVGRTAPAARTLRGRLTVPALVIVLLMLAGAAIRLIVAHESLFADELSTYWIVATHSFGGVISLMYSTGKIQHAEITPPLFFILSWLTTQISHSPELVRAPSLVAGILTIPVVYLLGLRTVGRTAGLLAAALTTLSPFMIYYSTEARGYAAMTLLTTLSTLAMLLALDTRRTRWWVLYGICSWAAFLTHYTCAFVLGAQFLWLLWAEPEARRAGVIANLGALVGLLPWAPGLINDLTSPTLRILSALSPFSAHYARLYLEDWAIGYPVAGTAKLTDLPGTLALALLGLATILAVPAIALRTYRQGAEARLARSNKRVLLIVALALAVPIGESLASALGNHLMDVRNLAASWPALALTFAALLIAAGPRLRVATATLAIAAFTLAAGKMLDQRFQRPDYQAAAAFIDDQARPGDVVIDESGVLSPGPLTGLEIALHRPIPVFRAGVAAERDHPFGFYDRIVPLSEAIPKAAAAAAGSRLFVVESRVHGGIVALTQRLNALVQSHIPSCYRRVAFRVYPGTVDTLMAVYAKLTRSRK